MKIKTTLRYLLTPVRMANMKKLKIILSCKKYMEKREHWYSLGENVN
jgi:hypothetical protein